MGLEYDLKQAYEDVISVFYEIAQDMASSFDENEIIDISLKLMKKVVDYNSISFLKYSSSKEMYTVKKMIDYNPELKKSLMKLIKEGIIMWSANAGKPMVNIEEIGNIKTTVIVPLVSKDELLGAIVLHTEKDENYFDLNRIKILSIISNQLTISFENIMLYNNVEKRNNKLKALKNYMDNIITSMTNGIIVFDNDNIMRVFNNKAEELLELSSKQVLGTNLKKSPMGEDFINVLKNLKTRTEVGELILDEEAEYLLPEGDFMPLGISTTVLRKDGKELGIIFVLRDMRESKELKELKRIDKLKDEFLSMVSHELRTPLTSIKAYTETLIYMVGEGDLESEREFLNIINEESERLSRLINDVLDLSKIEAGKMNFILKEEEINEVVIRASKNMKGFADVKKISIKIILAENLENVLIDKDRTLQVLANLINNAVKFTPEEGLIILMTEKIENNFIKVTVKDNGIGIKEDEFGKIFEKFQQSEDILTREAGGTGLGLPICKKIIEHYGGDIWVESKYREGSSFIFTVPLGNEQREE